jgi:PTS system nitrogen regulatory IIA component
MRTTELFPDTGILLDLHAAGKRDLLERLAAEAAALQGRDAAAVLEALLARERLGSTALGRGVGLPHSRMDGDHPPLMLFARLRRGLDFEARDDEPVDLVFMVLWPEAAPEGFLPALSELCRSLRDPQVLRRLRQAATPAEVLDVLGANAPGDVA